MTEQTAPATETVETVEKKRSAWKPLAAAGIGGAVLVATGFGVFAQLSATATSTQAISAGTLKMKLAPLGTSTGLSGAITNLAPLDTVNRYVTLTNSGTLDAAKDLTFGATPVAAADDNLFFDANRGLTVTILSCSTSWTVTDGTCSGSGATTTALAPTKLSALKGAALPVLTPAVVPANTATNYKIQLTLQDSVENTLNENTVTVTPAATGGSASIQGLSTNIKWAFTEVQRAATTTNS